MNDNEPTPVTIITGRVFRRKGGKAEGVHVMLVAPDDDSAVRRALEDAAATLIAERGYARTTVDDIVGAAGVSKPAQLHDNVEATRRDPLGEKLHEELRGWYEDRVKPSVRGGI